MDETIVEGIKAKLFRARLRDGAEYEAAERLVAAANPGLGDCYPDLRKTAEWIVRRAIAAGFPHNIATAPLSDFAVLIDEEPSSSAKDDQHVGDALHTFLIPQLVEQEIDRLEQAAKEQAGPTANQIAGGIIAELTMREERGRRYLQPPSPPTDVFPPTIKMALAGKRKLLPLCELLWRSREQFIDWDTIGAEVWRNGKEDVATMQKAARRLDSDLLNIRGCEYGVESNQQLGARIYQRTKNGQT